MEKRSLLESTVWNEFQEAAKKRRQNPVGLLTEYMRECLEVWEDQKLDEEIRRDVRRSGYREEDSVAIVRRHRSTKGHRATP
jgi:hypothetical protein